MCIRRATVHPPRHGRHAGATLIELIMFIMIVSLALAGVLGMLNMVVKHSADPMIRKQMLTLAESLLDEVELMPFTVCDPLTNTNPMAATTAECTGSGGGHQQFGYPTLGVSPRSNFNNIGNYCSNPGPRATSCTTLTLGSPSTPIPDMSGSTAASPVGYWATINLTPETLTVDSDGKVIWIVDPNPTAENMIALRITVTVHHGDDSLTLESYRARWWPLPLITP
ncbi:putative mannose-sensitive agglutinin (MSHA) biogenesis protein MshD (Pilus type IV) [Sterolibacterium denitrificans]|uniref:Mannose-sensitive agglutinin (MSHA) biogenesis protein MshD (Pilus type IV) n=1 Tax=Sterolibacterium denitrificans TaxID=157592 RepID=A0A7Z7MV74_9PROT|nr:hypothetical protein [Sterolibacterium denitrificans]SMB24363.1 putative mannose-sensitive agglutinin (MSHA) biogenesis protein MshD (Pilus type IV) [Sterolibacterium denitrificans]